MTLQLKIMHTVIEVSANESTAEVINFAMG